LHCSLHYLEKGPEWSGRLQRREFLKDPEEQGGGKKRESKTGTSAKCRGPRELEERLISLRTEEGNLERPGQRGDAKFGVVSTKEKIT